MVCRVLGKPRSWLYYRRRSGRGRPLRRPELEESVRQLLGASPTSYGYRRIHALLKRRGVACNPKTVWRVLRRRGWLSTSRRRIIRSGRRHEGRVQVSEPNRRWASDITSIRAWDGQKGRLAIMIDCADRMVLAWRFATRMTADDLAEMLREAIWHRFGGVRTHARGIEFLSDNGPEYTSHRFRPFVRAMGLIPCHTPRRSPESNGLAEAFFGSFKRDYVYQACLETVEDVARQLRGWIEHYNHQAPHSALGMQSPAECYAAWLVRNKTRPVQN
jgi:putative transposase